MYLYTITLYSRMFSYARDHQTKNYEFLCPILNHVTFHPSPYLSCDENAWCLDVNSPIEILKINRLIFFLRGNSRKARMSGVQVGITKLLKNIPTRNYSVLGAHSNSETSKFFRKTPKIV